MTATATRLIVTDDATYEQRTAGTSNAGRALTEVRRVRGEGKGLWMLLDPDTAEPRVGDRWTLRWAHRRYVLTDTVNEIIGDLE